MLADTLFSYSKRCLAENDSLNARIALNYIDCLPTEHNIALYKMLTKYYLIGLNKDLKSMDRYKKLIEINGYTQILKKNRMN